MMVLTKNALEDRMITKPEVLAAIISVAGNWALGMASSPDSGQIPQPSQMPGELPKHFEYAFGYLMDFIEQHGPTLE